MNGHGSITSGNAVSRRSFLGACATAGIAAVAPRLAFGQTSVAPRSSAQRPNILLLSTDQWHADVFSHLGYKGIQTPASDRIAARSTRFTRSYATNPVCTPARASWLTGRMPSEILNAGNKVVKSVPDLGEWFGQHGYDTAHIGKFDFPGRSAAKGFRVFSGIHPTGQYADLTVAQMARSYLLDRPKDKPFLMHVALMNPHDICQISCMWTSGGKLPIDLAELPPLPENFNARPPEAAPMAERIRKSFRRGMSFSWDETDWRYYRWLYYRYCEMVDVAVGQVLDALDVSGAADDTMLVYTSDHGEGMGHHGMHTKGFLYEESARVPFMVSLPGQLKAGGVDDETLVNGSDLFPTFCNVAGIPAPSDLCGVDFVKANRGEQPGRATLVAEGPLGGTMIRDGQYKLIRYKDDPTIQLFDLKADPGETTSVADANPDVVKRLASAQTTFYAGLKPFVKTPEAAATKGEDNSNE